MTIEIGRRGFLTGLVALVAAPAVIRVAPLMPISPRWTPAYVPMPWLGEILIKDPKIDVLLQRYGMKAFPLGGQDLKAHAWPRPLAPNWVNINDFDPGYVRAQLQARNDDEDWFEGYSSRQT